MNNRQRLALIQKITKRTFVLVSITLLVSCSSISQPSYDSLENVNVPDEWTANESVLPEDLRLGPRQRLHRQSYSIDKNGVFSFSRSVTFETGDLGVAVCPVSKVDICKLGLESPSGVRVSEVTEHGPASAAGIIAQDIVVAMGPDTLRSVDQFESIVGGSEPSTEVALVVYRDGMQFETTAVLGAEVQTVTVGGFQRELPVRNHRAHSGMVVAELFSEVRPLVFGPYESDKGIVVVDLLPGGPAFDSQVRIGDVITRINEQSVDTIRDFDVALAKTQPGDLVPVSIRRQQMTVDAHVRIEEDALEETNLRVIVVSYCNSAARTSFSLAGNILFKYFNRSTIECHANEMRHWTVSNWSFVLSLISFRRTPEESKLELLWIIPLWFSEK